MRSFSTWPGKIRRKTLRTGFPEITVPAGIIEGNLPVGVSFLGGYGEDAKVVGFGYAFLGR